MCQNYEALAFLIFEYLFSTFNRIKTHDTVPCVSIIIIIYQHLNVIGVIVTDVCMLKK